MRLNGTEAPNLGKATNRFRKVEARVIMLMESRYCLIQRPTLSSATDSMPKKGDFRKNCTVPTSVGVTKEEISASQGTSPQVSEPAAVNKRT